MVSIRSVHLYDNHSQFNFAEWLEGLNLPQKDINEKLSAIWQYCYEQDNDPVLLHCGVEMVEILNSLSMDSDSLSAALLYPFVQAARISQEQVAEKFGLAIENLVQGVIAMDGIGQLKATYSDTATSSRVDNIRRMLLAMVEDFRCVIIKLAERITFLRRLEQVSEEEQVLAAKECFNIYAPLANRLGIGQLKWEMEDLCFRYQNPDKYHEIAKLLDEKRIDREKYIDDFVTDLKAAMQQEGIDVQIYGRPKHIYSIWRKLKKKNLLFSELYDVRAIRVVVNRVQDCYAALGIIHTKYRHLPKEFDDYIANPKPNGYQSIHTVVFGPEGKTVEIQSRTQQMHDDAELGVAAHWKYKEDNKSHRTVYDDKIAWLRKLLNWQEEISRSGGEESDVFDEVYSQVFDDQVYVFTPKGDVIDLPAGSTPLDFAYHIHSDIGHRCIGARVGGRIVPFMYQLQMGDQVEIITQKYPNPSRDWLNANLGFVTSSRARSKIQLWFKKQDREKNVIAGRQILDDVLHTLNLTVKDVEKLLVARYNVQNMEKVLAGIGAGDIRINQLTNFLHTQFNKPSAEEEDEEALKQLTQHVANKQNSHQSSRNQGKIIIEGVGNLLHHIAKCCQPIPGDNIVGFITQGRGVSVHRENCEQLAELKMLSPDRIVNAEWGNCYANGYQLVLRIISMDRSGLLRDITTILANEKVNVLGVSSRSDVKKLMATIDMEIEIYNQETLGRVLVKINQLPDIIEAKRLSD